MFAPNSLDSRRPLLNGLDRLLALCALGADTGEPSCVALLAAVDELKAAAVDFPGALGTAALILGEAFLNMAGPSATATDADRLRDAQAILSATLAADRALTLDAAHRLAR